MSQSSEEAWVCRDTETRALRLTPDDTSLECAEQIYDMMRIDRPHMAARLSKLMPKLSDDERSWSSDVIHDHVHLWALKAIHGSLHKFVAIIWFELVGNGHSSLLKKDSLSSGPRNPTTAHIEVLWTHPQHRQSGFGSQLVRSVLVRYPNITKWTAFTSRDMKKDAGVNRFWNKNGFHQDTIEVGKVNQDGFFIRNSALESTKRRRVQTQLFEIVEDRKASPRSG